MSPTFVDFHDCRCLNGSTYAYPVHRSPKKSELAVDSASVRRVGVTGAIVAEVGLTFLSEVHLECRRVLRGFLEIFIIVVVEGGYSEIRSEEERLSKIEPDIEQRIVFASCYVPAVCLVQRSRKGNVVDVVAVGILLSSLLIDFCRTYVAPVIGRIVRVSEIGKRSCLDVCDHIPWRV